MFYFPEQLVSTLNEREVSISPWRQFFRSKVSRTVDSSTSNTTDRELCLSSSSPAVSPRESASVVELKSEEPSSPRESAARRGVEHVVEQKSEDLSKKTKRFFSRRSHNKKRDLISNPCRGNHADLEGGTLWRLKRLACIAATWPRRVRWIVFFLVREYVLITISKKGKYLVMWFRMYSTLCLCFSNMQRFTSCHRRVLCDHKSYCHSNKPKIFLFGGWLVYRLQWHTFSLIVTRTLNPKCKALLKPFKRTQKHKKTYFILVSCLLLTTGYKSQFRCRGSMLTFTFRNVVPLRKACFKWSIHGLEDYKRVLGDPYFD